MTEQYIGWALLVGGVVGGALVWFILGRLPRRTEDVPPAERRVEAMWIADVIESRGGIAPPALVDEVLELHARYLAGPPLDVRPDAAWRATAAYVASPPVNRAPEPATETPAEPATETPADPADLPYQPPVVRGNDATVPVETTVAVDDANGVGAVSEPLRDRDRRRSELPDEDRSAI